MKFRPHPGIVIIQLIESDSLIPEKKTNLLKGEIIAIGEDVDQGDVKRIMKDYAKIGDVVYFLSYEGGYDHAEIDHKTYYMVKCDDLRTRI